MKAVLISMLILVTSQFSVAQFEISDKEALSFFKLYHQMIEERSKSVIQLISDDALLYSETQYQTGPNSLEKYELEKVFRFIETVQAYLHQNKEESDFERVKLTREGEQVKITAQRFSKTNCYLDKGYYLIMERERNFIKVIEEKINIQNNASCDQLDDVEIKTQ